MEKKNVAQIITEQIIGKLKEGVAPWRQPWKPGQVAMNWFTEKPYRGINLLLTQPGGEYATKKQIKDAGGKIKPEEYKKASIVLFYTDRKKENEEGEEEKVIVRRFYYVWNINTQCEGLTSKRSQIAEGPAGQNPIEAAEEIIINYMNKPDIRYESGQAFYHRALDYVSVPPITDYTQPEEYYCTLYHELIHSTGSEDRLNRQKGRRFGDGPYSREELVAEMGAAILCNLAGIDQPVIDNSAAYIQSWLKSLNNDHNLVIVAANAAQKAVDYIVNAISFIEEKSA